MFNIGPGELVVILLLALILLGPKKLPEAARAIGKGMRELRRATEDLKGTLEQEIGGLDEPPRPPLAPPRPGVPESVPSSGPYAGQQALPAQKSLGAPVAEAAPPPENSDPTPKS
jgi:sec-independent protein translocase protein TatB